MQKTNLKVVALFLFSIVVIAYELFIMRVFAVGSWSNFGFLIISTALLGFGLAGTLLTLINKKVRQAPHRWLSVSAIAFLPAMTLGYVFSQLIPFNPILISQDPLQLLWIAAYYFLYGVPFFLAALYIGIMFMILTSQMYKLYFWNMLGSGLGGILVLLLMYLLPPEALIYPLLILAGLAVLFTITIYDEENKRLCLKASNFWAGSIVFVISFVILIFGGRINVSEFKSISAARNFKDATLVHHSISPLGEVHVFASSMYHSAPGLSDMAIINLVDNPRQHYWGLYNDGDGPMYIMGKLVESETAYLDYLPMAAPYNILSKPNVLLVDLNGGISANLALYRQASKVTVVEPNPEIVRILKDDPVISKYNGELLKNSKIEIIKDEPRAFCATHPDTFDLVEISLIDAIGFDKAQGYAISENFRYTKEAFQDYLESLKPQGILSLTVWNMLEPPRNVLKLLATAFTTFKENKVANPAEHIFAFGLHRSTVTILLKKSPFTAEELASLKDFVELMSFEPIFYNGIKKTNKNFVNIMAYYINYFSDELEQSKLKEERFKPTDLYQLAIFEMLAGNEDKLYRDYVFDITPITDDRPYYSSYLKFDKLFSYLAQPLKVIEEWGFLLILGVFIQSILFAIFIIIIPIIGSFRELFAEKRKTFRVIIYFSCLGLGYMLMEMFLIQRLVFFLSDPIFATSIVLTSMLVISGLGSIASRFIAKSRIRVVRIAVLMIILTSLFYLFGLSSLLKELLGAPFLVKVLITILIIAPAAFFMGIRQDYS